MLKQFVSNPPSQLAAVLAVLATKEEPTKPRQIRETLISNGARAARRWNISLALNRLESDNLVICTPEGWEISELGNQKVSSMGFTRSAQNVNRVRSRLAALIDTESSDATKAYLVEVISAFELGLHRSAVVMSWVASVHLLQTEVVHKHLNVFNKEALRRDAKWRSAKDLDGLTRLKEHDLLQIMAAIGALPADIKKNIEPCLVRRNSCGHPNSYSLDENTVAHHVETLILNVFNRFPDAP